MSAAHSRVRKAFAAPPQRARPWKPHTAAARPGARRAEVQQRQAAPPALELRKRFALPGTGGTACVLRHVTQPSSVFRGMEGMCMVFFSDERALAPKTRHVISHIVTHSCRALLADAMRKRD